MRVYSIGANMIEVDFFDMTILISYETPVACFNCGQGHMKTSKKHSNTTSRHIKKWLDGAEAKEMPQEFFDGLMDRSPSK